MAPLVAHNRATPTQRRYRLNEHYFDEIDTEEKAYWLGFIAGDGAIIGGSLVVGLAERDRGHLLALASALGADQPVRKTSAIVQGKAYPGARLAIASWRLVEGLASQGIRPRKSRTLRPWDAPSGLMAHYWRGLIDADGSIILGPGWGLSLVGTESIVTAFGDWARTIDPSIASQPRRSKSIWEFRIGGRHQARTVAKALYEGCRVALPRKAQRAAELITTPPRVESPLGTVSVSITSARGGYQPHGTTGYGRGCRCIECRAAHRVAAQGYAQRVRLAGSARSCAACGTDISRRHGNARYCESCPRNH